MIAYINIPGIRGNVTTEGYEGWIELGSIDYKINAPVQTTMGSQRNRMTSAITASEFLLGKGLDESSPLIFSESCSSSGVKQAVEIHFCQTCHGQLKPWQTLKLYDVLFSGYHTSSLCVNGFLVSGELFGLSFDNLEIHHYPRDSRGKLQSPIRLSGDIHSSQHGFSLLELPEIPQWVVDVVAGFGDSLSFGLTNWVRSKMGTNEMVNHHSKAYYAGDITGMAFPATIGAKMAKWTYVAAKYGREIKIGKDVRIAPFGNRTEHPLGKWPHYHRRVPGLDGVTLDGQGIGRHRPWQTSVHDTSFFNRL